MGGKRSFGGVAWRDGSGDKIGYGSGFGSGDGARWSRLTMPHATYTCR